MRSSIVGVRYAFIVVSSRAVSIGSAGCIDPSHRRLGGSHCQAAGINRIDAVDMVVVAVVVVVAVIVVTAVRLSVVAKDGGRRIGSSRRAATDAGGGG